MSGTRSDTRKRIEEAERYEARRREVRECERRREVVQQALERVYHGADFTDADCLLDQLADLGASVVVR